MSVTKTTITGPSNIAPNLKVASYTILWDGAYANNGEPIDLSGDFDYVYGVSFGGNDTLADNGYICQAVLPGATTTVTTSNVKLSMWVTGSAVDAVLGEASTVSLSAIGATSIFVWGA